MSAIGGPPHPPQHADVIFELSLTAIMSSSDYTVQIRAKAQSAEFEQLLLRFFVS